MKNIFIDSNVFMYAHGASHKYKEPSLKIMRLVALDAFCGLTSSEVLQEILYRYSAINKKSLGRQIVFNTLSVIHEVLPVDKNDILTAIHLMDKYHWLPVRDAIHVSCAIGNNIRYILSADRHFDRVKEINRIDPLEY